ncbi:MAG: N-acetylmuramoyl-L-alanine amidase [Bacilli bacterium]
MKVIKNLVSENKYSIKCPYKMNPTRIVVHNTANDASARNEISYMIRNNNKVSFHYAVDDVEVVQGIEENRNSWNAGDGSKGKGNREGISIEICYSKSGGTKFIKSEENAVKLIVDILKRYGWNLKQVTKHQDYMNKYCPHRTLDMGWNRFLDLIKTEFGNSNIVSKPVVELYKVRITASVLNIRNGAGTNYEVNGKITDKGIYTIIEEKNGWGKLKSGAGWISLAYTNKNTNLVLKSKKVNAKKGLWFRSSANLNSKKIKLLPYNSEVTVLHEKEINSDGYSWSKVIYKGKNGYVADNYLK